MTQVVFEWTRPRSKYKLCRVRTGDNGKVYIDALTTEDGEVYGLAAFNPDELKALIDALTAAQKTLGSTTL